MMRRPLTGRWRDLGAIGIWVTRPARDFRFIQLVDGVEPLLNIFALLHTFAP